MRKFQTSIDKYLFEAIKAIRSKSFTVIQLRDAYLRILPRIIGADEARITVYRQLVRLTKAGILKKNEAKNSQQTTYTPQENFDSINFLLRIPKHQKHDEYTATSNKKLSANREYFKEQLRQYQVDLLSSIGESEEYKRLYESNPELRSLLETQYRKARDESSRILGQIKALKNVMSHFSE